MLPPPVMLFSSRKEVRMPRLRMAMTMPRTEIVRRWFSGTACRRTARADTANMHGPGPTAPRQPATRPHWHV